MDVSGDEVRVRVFYQIDPGGAVTGGIDSIIRGLIKWAPPDIRISIVGITMDPVARPVGKWSQVQIGDRSVPFFPVGSHAGAMQRGRVPLSVRLALGMLRHWRAVSADCDVLEFHRIEPALLFLADRRYRNLFIHQNMRNALGEGSDVLWRHAPRLYFALERAVLPRCDSIFVVRSDAAAAYRAQFPRRAERFRFLPTWMDPQVFHPATDVERQAGRARLAQRYQLPATRAWIIAVGRLDSQKDPLLMIEAFARAKALGLDAHLLLVGDGPLRAAVAQGVDQRGLGGEVTLCGVQPPGEVAEMLRASDLYLMTSAYEGMPISVLEALATGLPVVATAVGEIPRVVRTGENGQLVSDRSAGELAEAMCSTLRADQEALRRQAACSVEPFHPAQVLTSVYDAYRCARPRIAVAN